MGISNKDIQWNETTRVLLIEAVIRVEEETRLKPNVKISGKWDRISNLLPSPLRGQAPCSRSRRPDYKCRRKFQILLEAYRGRRRGFETILTKPVREIMKKREDLLNTRRSTPADISLNSGRPTGASNSTGSASDQTLLSPCMNNFTDTHTNWRHLSERQTIGTAAERKDKEGGNFFPHTSSGSKQLLPWSTELHESFVDAVTELGGARKALPEDVLRVMGIEGLTISQVRSHLKIYRLRYIAKSTWEGNTLENENDNSEDVIATTHAPSMNHAVTSLGCAPKCLGESEGPEDQNKPSGSTVRLTSDSVSETFQDPERMAAQASTPENSPTFKSDSKAHTRHDQHIDSILDELLRRPALEFSSLSSWVESKLIPDGKKVMYGMTSSVIQSVKRRKLNARTDPLDDIVHKSRNRIFDLQIQTSFQKLKVRFAEELKNTSMEVVQLVRQDIDLLYSSRVSSRLPEK